MSKARMHDLVLVLLGITGSILRRADCEVWAVLGGALWNAVTPPSATVSRNSSCPATPRAGTRRARVSPGPA
jgi:hypothetical protein